MNSNLRLIDQLNHSPLKEKQEMEELCIDLIDVLSGDREFSSGMGLKNIRKNFWEIRKGLKKTKHRSSCLIHISGI